MLCSIFVSGNSGPRLLNRTKFSFYLFIFNVHKRFMSSKLLHQFWGTSKILRFERFFFLKSASSHAKKKKTNKLTIIDHVPKVRN